jgi:hypothetical protein
MVANLQERAEQASREADEAKQAAERANSEAERANSEAEKANSEAERANSEAAKSRSGIRKSIVRILVNRGVTCSPESLSMLEACTDADLLDQWLMRAFEATNEAEVFGEKTS